MALKFAVLAALVACARSSGVVAPTAEPYDPNPLYSYGYEVQDPLTGDNHGQVESRSGDVVRGSYALLDSDGARRVVDYSADSVNGFNAVVSRQPIAAPINIGPIVEPSPAISKQSSSLALPLAPGLSRVTSTGAVLPLAPVLRTAPLLPNAPVPAPALYVAPSVRRIAPAAPLVGRSVVPAPVIGSGPLAVPVVAAAPWASSVVAV